jgi:hypothetical protein
MTRAPVDYDTISANYDKRYVGNAWAGVDEERYPATEWIRAWLEDAGFASADTAVALHRPRSQAAELALSRGLLAKHTTSQLIILSDAEYAEGIARIEAEVEAARRRGETLERVSDLRLYATRAPRVMIAEPHDRSRSRTQS